jgi:hypothetical protein
MVPRAQIAREVADEAERVRRGRGVELRGVTWIASATK